jgi:hypothetical protein
MSEMKIKETTILRRALQRSHFFVPFIPKVLLPFFLVVVAFGVDLHSAEIYQAGGYLFMKLEGLFM